MTQKDERALGDWIQGDQKKDGGSYLHAVYNGHVTQRSDVLQSKTACDCLRQFAHRSWRIPILRDDFTS